VEGVLVRQNPTTGLLVLSVELLRQSVAVEVDGYLGGSRVREFPPSCSGVFPSEYIVFLERLLAT